MPSSISKLTKLNTIFLSNNQLTGSLKVLESCPNPYDFELSYNKFTGSLPKLQHMENMTELDLDHNELTGSIPSSYSALAVTSATYINDNQLSGVIPIALINLDPYAILSMHNNHFTFDSLEYIIANSTHYYLEYSPQPNIPIIYTPQGAFGKLSVHAGGTLSNNTYQWYKNNSLYQTIVGDSIFIPDGEGVYFVKVNNSVVTNLQLLSDSITIVTACASSPINTATKNITSTSAKLTWSASQGALKYQVQFKPASATTFTSKNTKSTSINITGLSPNTQYVWKVKAICSLQSSAFTALNNFTTLSAFRAPSQSSSEIQPQTDFALYPNPATENVNVLLNASKQASYLISIYDLQGRKLKTQEGVTNLGKNNFTFEVHTLSAGTYLVKINYDDKTIVKKLLKE